MRVVRLLAAAGLGRERARFHESGEGVVVRIVPSGLALWSVGENSKGLGAQMASARGREGWRAEGVPDRWLGGPVSFATVLAILGATAWLNASSVPLVGRRVARSLSSRRLVR